MDDDIKSFEDLYYYLYTKLLRFSANYLHQNKEAAEDIVSEVFIKCWENRKSNLHVLSPESYLFIATRNQSLKYIKKHGGTELIELDASNEHHFVNHNDPQSSLEQKELHKILDLAIETLPPQAKMVFRLIKESGMKYKEVADILEISPRTVQTQLFRAIAKLRVTLKLHQPPRPPDNETGDNMIDLLILVSLITFFSTL